MQLISVIIKPLRTNVFSVKGMNGEFYDTIWFPPEMWGKEYYSILAFDGVFYHLIRFLSVNG